MLQMAAGGPMGCIGGRAKTIESIPLNTASQRLCHFARLHEHGFVREVPISSFPLQGGAGGSRLIRQVLHWMQGAL